MKPVSDFPTPYPLQFRGSRLARWVLGLAGWKVHFEGLPALQGVLVVYPHTSNWDFIVMILAKWSVGVPVRFWGKDSLFRLPLFGRWLRWLGGIPVLRRAPQGVVAPMVQRLREAAERDEFFWLALSPEGTRARTEGWRSGFYQVALGAGVPIGLAYIDYPSRRVGLAGFLQLCGEPASDLAAIAERLAHHRGKRPALAAPIRLGR